MLHQNVPRKTEREMGNRSVGPLTKEHVPKLEELLEKYKSASTWHNIERNDMNAGLCLAIMVHLGVEVYSSSGFYYFIGIERGNHLCRTPHQLYYDSNIDEVLEECIKPRIEALEKIINYLKN